MPGRNGNQTKSVCIFDFDGTLVDSMDSFADLAAELIEVSYGTPRDQARQDYLRTSGLPFFEQLEVLFPGSSLNSIVADSFERKKREDYLSRSFFQEVPETLRGLKEKEVRVVVSSNNGQEIVEEYLANQNTLETQFDLVLGFRPGFSKGPDHFDRVLEHFDLEVEEVLFVGDSLQDAKKAINFGVDFVGRLGTFSRSHFLQNYPQVQVVENLRELMGVVCR